jgi:hypothetical protein
MLVAFGSAYPHFLDQQLDDVRLCDSPSGCFLARPSQP